MPKRVITFLHTLRYALQKPLAYTNTLQKTIPHPNRLPKTLGARAKTKISHNLLKLSMKKTKNSKTSSANQYQVS